MTENIEIDDEFQSLSSLDKSFKISIEKLPGNNFKVNITLDKSLITQKFLELKDNLKFVLYIKKNHPKASPHLYCLSKFCYPEICDPRDYLEDVIKEKWGNNKKYYHLKTIIKKIPKFIEDYIEDIQTQHIFIGKLYLDSIYENKLLILFPNLFFDNVNEKVYLENSDKYYDESRKLLISEGFFLLFVEKSIFESEKLRLIFYASIKSLMHIKHYTESDIVELTWKIKGKKNILMRIMSNDADKIVRIIMDILKKKSIKYKITNRDFRPKEGELPQIKIDIVEEEINKYEVTLRLQENVNKENVSYLMELYEKAVQYYSAVNDNKYELYMGKIQEMFANDEYTKLLNDKKTKITDIDKIYYNSQNKENSKKDENEKEANEKGDTLDKNNIKISKKEPKNNKEIKNEGKKDDKTENGKEEKKEGKNKEIKKEEVKEKNKEIKFAVEGNLKKSDLDFESDEDDD